MTMSAADGATINCIGFCNSKLFQERRRVFRPGPCGLPPQDVPTITKTVRSPCRKNIKVKRMHTRRDRRRNAGGANVESQDEPFKDEEEEEKSSKHPVARIFFGICGLLLVIIGIGIVIYVIIVVVSLTTSTNLLKWLKKSTRNDMPLSTASKIAKNKYVSAGADQVT